MASRIRSTLNFFLIQAGRPGGEIPYWPVHPAKVYRGMFESRRNEDSTGFRNDVFFTAQPYLDLATQIENVVRIGAEESQVFIKIMVMFFSAMWSLLQKGMENEGLLTPVDGFDFVEYANTTFEGMRKAIKERN